MKTRKFKVKGGMRSPWVTIQGTTKQEEKARRNRAANQTIRQLASMGAIGAKMLLPADQKRHIYRCRALPMRNAVKQETAQKQLEAEIGIPAQNTIGGDCMDELDRKVIAAFPGKSVRKDLTSLMKKGANVPTYVLEYLLGMYCATDDDEAIRAGLEKIKKILSENYVRPDQSDYVKSKIKENGQYTVIDKVTVRMDEAEDKYVASFTNLDLKDFEVNSDLVTHNEKLLVGGIWCIIKIEYVGLKRESEENEDETDIFDDSRKRRSKKQKRKPSRYDSPFAIAALKPIQMANLDLEEIFETRKQFTREEWITLFAALRRLRAGRTERKTETALSASVCAVYSEKLQSCGAWAERYRKIACLQRTFPVLDSDEQRSYNGIQYVLQHGIPSCGSCGETGTVWRSMRSAVLPIPPAI